MALAKQKPGKINYGSAGNGTPGHLTGEMFKAAAGIDIQHVPYKGSAPAVTDLLAGQIQMMFDPLQSVMSHVQAGKLRAIAVSSAARSPAATQCAHRRRVGLSRLRIHRVVGRICAGQSSRRGDRRARRRASSASSMAAPSDDRLGPLGVVPTLLTLKAFGEFQRARLAKWGKAVRDSGATVD